MAYADGEHDEGIMSVPDSRSAVVMDGQKAAVQALVKEVDLGS
jgi:hypothetical protein